MKVIERLFSQLEDSWQSEVAEHIKRDDVSETIRIVLQIATQIPGLLNKEKNTGQQDATARAMKFIPSSETLAGGKKTRKRGKRSGEELIRYHRDRQNYHARRLRRLKKLARKKAEREKKERTMVKTNAPIEDPNDDLTEEEMRAQDEETAKEFAELQEALALKADDGARFKKADFEVMNSPSISHNEEEMSIPANREGTDSSWRSAFVNTTRYGFSFSVTKYSCKREVLTDSVSGEHRAAIMANVGPKGSQFTWGAIANLILLIVGTAIPMHRLERLLGKGIFRRPNMVRLVSDFAWRYLPVYLYSAKVLANAGILSGDDTGTRVNEVTRWKRLLAKAQAKDKNATVEKPWEERIAKWKKEDRTSLVETLNAEFGFEFKSNAKIKKGEEPKNKIALHTSVVTGLADQNDPTSRLVFYRTHFGSFGNILGSILQRREEKNADLIVQGDLSSSNNVLNPAKWLKIRYAGCTAHARRPFKRFYSQDPDACDALLSCFSMMAMYEHDLDDAGRNSANVTAVRKKIISKYWQQALDICKSLLSTWSDQTPIGNGIRYIIKGYPKLILYLSEPHLSPDNNLAENLLRYEALEDNSSFGRATLEGRARYDIARSAVATCTFADIDPRVFICFILMAEKEAVGANPEHYTPQALNNWLEVPGISSLNNDLPKIQAWVAAIRAVSAIYHQSP